MSKVSSGPKRVGQPKHQNKIGFTADRGVKLTEKETIKKEGIKNGAKDNLCPRCADKIEWKFRYGKFKHLRAAARCNGCRQACVRFPYRTLCDACAKERKVCPSCCEYGDEETRKRMQLLKTAKKFGLDVSDLGEGAKKGTSGQQTSAVESSSSNSAEPPFNAAEVLVKPEASAEALRMSDEEEGEDVLDALDALMAEDAEE
ncbi:hypothetical protein CYMTET_10615 [Cymbomonas tetramitiformis]|uniref:Uncharacterized protein n=1 Tax=Cymbomonas tetramitiformis TaxID=36881 RepID=A0AAE0LEA6_9CHLO|nr:hypothetical protein CYMTET_10615 [Cymbomonas tetramitiformis]